MHGNTTNHRQHRPGLSRSESAPKGTHSLSPKSSSMAASTPSRFSTSTCMALASPAAAASARRPRPALLLACSCCQSAGKVGAGGKAATT